MANDIIVFSDKVKATPTGLTIKASLPFEEWEAIGGKLQTYEGAIHWWIGDWLNFGEKTYGETYAQAVEETGLDNQTLRNDKWVSNAIELSRRRDNLTFSHHSEVAALEPDEQDELLGLAEQFDWTRRTLRQEVQKFKVSKALADPGEPNGKYRIIYADPAWEYGNVMPDGFKEQRDHYLTMTPEAVAELPIYGLGEDNSVLFLWVTSPILEESFSVVKAWGYEYKTSFVWDKVKHVMGHYNSVRHEILLVCVRGSCQPDVRQLFDSVYSEERTEHSKKPEYFRNVIDTIYPIGKRIELFARERHENWDTWGNEL